ncbi:MAG: hypothetical protein J6R07_01925 [Bacteroidaceae bacterium]|nr:hypothetical protein [Bacteroidaceae bacterium]
MSKKTLTVLLLGTLSVFVSCVDNKYDLANKDISRDIKIEGNRIAVPFGSLKAITLDSIVDVDEIDVLKKGSDGLFRINMSDSIDTVKVEIDPVKLSIERQTHSDSIDFETVDIDSVHVEATHIDPMEFTSPEISLDSLNDKLPRLESHVPTEITNDEIDRFFNLPSENIKPFTVTIDKVFGTGTQSVSCDFEYKLPDEVATINTIMLGDNASSPGTLVEVSITNSDFLSSIKKTADFTIRFPDYFVLYTDNENYELSEGKNEIRIEGMNLGGTESVVSFYIQQINDVHNKIKEGRLVIEDDIVYSVDYNLSGSLELSSSVTRKDLELNVDMDVQLAFKDVKGAFRDIDVDFDPIAMDFKGHFNDLEYIDTIYYVDFNEEISRLKFESIMDTAWLGGFGLKDGYALKVQFPKNIAIDDSKSTYESKGSKIKYNALEHAFYVYDLAALAGTQWNLALDSLILNKPVIDNECDVDVEAQIYFVNAEKDSVGQFVLGGMQVESMIGVLNKLGGTKKATFNMQATDLVIHDAAVHTEVIKSDLETSTDFTINEEIPEDIGRIEGIDLVEDGVMNLDLSLSGIEGIENDELEVHLALDIAMPSFLKLKEAPEERKSENVKITVNGGLLHIDAVINPSESTNMNFDVICAGLDFKTDEFNNIGVLPKDSTNGKSYLVYDGSISVVGEAYIDSVKFHADVLECLDDIVFDVIVNVSDMEVKTFHGVYRGEIDKIEESVDLDLGEDLDFLKDEGNSIVLAEPQIEIVLENTICVPVDIDMQIFGKDDNGDIIPTSVIDKKLSILPAEYVEETGEIKPVVTKLFLTADSTKVAKVGYTNVQVENLANLLKRIPETIDFTINPVVNTSETHHVDISKPLTFTGSYEVNIPLKFDNFNFVYNDTITGLSDSFSESLDMLSNVKFGAKMNITNTIPLTLAMDVKPLDINGNLIDGMEIAPVVIMAGKGGSIEGNEQEAQKVEFVISSTTADFSALDMLSMSVRAAADHTTGSAGIKGEQGIKIEDIVLEIVGDIEMDLNE